MIPRAQTQLGFLDETKRSIGEDRRDRGIARVTANDRDGFISYMRAWAVPYANEHGRITADDVRRHAAVCDREPHHPNAYGALLRGCPGLRFSGEYVQSTTPSRHSGLIRVWVPA